MKKLFVFCSVLALILFLGGCSKTEVGSNHDLMPKVDIASVGIDHNKGLDIALKAILNAPRTRADFINIDLIDFTDLKAFLLPSDLPVVYVELIKETIIELRDFSHLPMEEHRLYTNFNDAQLIAIDCLETIMTDDDIDYNSLRGRISGLESMMVYEFGMSSEERLPILLGSAVAVNTLDYWRNNIDKWSLALLGTPIDHTVFEKGNSFSWKGVGKQDVRGAISGVGGWAIGALAFGGPIGAKAVATAAIGGAIFGSFRSIVQQLWFQELVKLDVLKNFAQINLIDDDQIISYLEQLSDDEKMELLDRIEGLSYADKENLGGLLRISELIYKIYM